MPGSADDATLWPGLKGGVNLPAAAAAALPSADQYSAKSEERAFLRREVS